MDFNTIRKIEWERLKRRELGSNYNNIFDQINSVLINYSKLLLVFESSFSVFLPDDQKQISDLSTNFLSLIKRTINFRPLEGETITQGVSRSLELLKDVKDFYNSSRPIISALQVNLRAEAQSFIIEQYKNTQNSFEKLSNEIRLLLNNKIKEIETEKNTQNQTISEFLERFERIFNDKIKEIDGKSTQQDKLVNNLISKVEDNLIKKGEELNKTIYRAEKNILEITKTKDEVDKLAESTKNFSLASITKEYGKIFKEESQKNLQASRYFGIAFVASVSVAILVVIEWLLPLVKEFSSNIEDIEYYILALIARIAVLFFVYWISRELLRNYNANIHLYNLNTHRYNSLTSFEVIVRNNVLPENRDDIVKQIAQTIFTHQDDGFLSNDSKDISIDKMISIFNAIKSK